MKEYEFAPERFTQNRTSLFPEPSSWILFHGMSERYSASVEVDGFVRRPAIQLPPRSIESLLQTFVDLRWNGYRTGGFPTLLALTRTAERGARSVYFGESPIISLPYATRHYAGGERFRAVRLALEDLAKFSRHAGLGRSFRALLRSRLSRLGDLQERVNDEFATHPGGVIYAVKFLTRDLKALELIPWMGVRARARIPFDRIIGKMRVPASYAWDGLTHRESSAFFDDRCGLGMALFRAALKKGDRAAPVREGCVLGDAYESVFFGAPPPM